MADETKRVQLEVAERRRDAWDKHVEETPGLNTRAELIRKSVERFIADDSSSDELNDALDTVIEQNEEALQQRNQVDQAVERYLTAIQCIQKSMDFPLKMKGIYNRPTALPH